MLIQQQTIPTFGELVFYQLRGLSWVSEGLARSWCCMKGSRKSSQLVLDRQGKDVPFGGSWLLVWCWAETNQFVKNQRKCWKSRRDDKQLSPFQPQNSQSHPHSLWETSSNLFNTKDRLKAKTQLCSEYLSRFLSEPLSSFCPELYLTTSRKMKWKREICFLPSFN